MQTASLVFRRALAQGKIGLIFKDIDWPQQFNSGGINRIAEGVAEAFGPNEQETYLLGKGPYESNSNKRHHCATAFYLTLNSF